MSRFSTLRSVLAITLALGLVAGACGGGDAEASPVEAALATTIGADADLPGMDADTASCVAREIVNGIGEDRLASLGVTADNVPALEDIALDNADVSIVISSYDGCMDLVEAFTQGLAEDIGEENATCMADWLMPANIKEALRASIAGDEAALERLDGAMAAAASACGLS